MNEESLLKLDSLDRDILYELDHNSRQPVADIARTLDVGRERVTYRMQKLEDRGVIRNFTTSVNPYKFGLIVYKTYVQVENDKRRLSRFLDHLEKHPRVYWYAECDGTWDLMFAIFGKNPSEFYAIQGEILSKFNDIIIGFNVYTIVEAWFFRKAYLRGLGTDYFLFGGAPKNYGLTKLDFNILKCMSNNSRLSAVEVAEQVKSTPNIVRNRIQSLEDKGIILGYRVELNLPAIGMTFFKAQLHLRNYEIRGERELKEYCKVNPHIILFIQQIGDCKFELEYEVKDYQQFNHHIDELRERFSKYIRRVDSIMIRRERYKWMPVDIVET